MRVSHWTCSFINKEDIDCKLIGVWIKYGELEITLTDKASGKVMKLFMTAEEYREFHKLINAIYPYLDNLRYRYGYGYGYGLRYGYGYGYGWRSGYMMLMRTENLDWSIDIDRTENLDWLITKDWKSRMDENYTLRSPTDVEIMDKLVSNDWVIESTIHEEASIVLIHYGNGTQYYVSHEMTIKGKPSEAFPQALRQLCNKIGLNFAMKEKKSLDTPEDGVV